MDRVSRFYTGPGGLIEAIGAALDGAGLSRGSLRTMDLAAVDEFHIRGRVATLEIIEALSVGQGTRVLDLGSGLGGPARTLAELTGCTVVGIDLTPEFGAVAAELSRWTGLSERTTFLVGDATRTGIPDAVMDAVMTVHVAMNIADKLALYAEALRVLRPGGRFVVYDVLQGEGGDVVYPVPWAHEPSTSHLETPERMRQLLTSTGFAILSERDSSDDSLVWFREVREKIERDGPPPVTFAAFLGDAFGQMAANQVRNLAERRIRTVMYLCERPARQAPEAAST
ncbi:class I SAM-dependent methyltransferase [Demequina capsici]|uniref:Class I SAM-dependent methyltransferase n=1 Tax=Demequina capsici TaxID=3075620 RepID=A0AA96JH86_9MICO|nr:MULTISPECIES: class I SAM-dependent methyltransferase [unclassified Demequina]WNM25844.1 class I SAM-dependent methyltransferase [Demequina sp. OYTSA14]WNM28739.1 class I SAM-dependent methyltransferase [Demequina sp. PMTSA13]